MNTKWEEDILELHRKSQRPYLFADDYENAIEQDTASRKVLSDFIKDQITKAQQESYLLGVRNGIKECEPEFRLLAEQIIEDIPEWMDVEPHNLKDQLRKKYL